MNLHRAALGLCMLCALFISAFAAQSAAAAESKGTTAFTCEETGPGGGFTKAHCKPGDAGSGNFSHVAVAQDTTTEVEYSSEDTGETTETCTDSTLKATIGGVATELRTCVVEGSEAWMENKVEPGEKGEHYLVGHGTITYTDVEVVKPAGCKVYTDVTPGGTKGEEGVVHTTPLKLTTTQQGDSVKITPTEGNHFASFIIDGCPAPFQALNTTYSVSGSLTCKPNGATINCNHNEVTTQNTLKLNGAIKAGYNGSLTVSGRANDKEEYTPLSVTTVETK